MTPSAERRGELLLGLARQSVFEALGRPAPEPAPVNEAERTWLAEPGATFVTLTLDGALRGCVGSIEARVPLADDVARNARAAAFEDSRFPALEAFELAAVRFEVSLLGPLEKLEHSSEAEALSLLRPGVDGVVLRSGERRATFLPQVWRTLPEPRAFLTRLKEKAGLPADFWSPELGLWRYSVTKWPPASRR